MSDTTLNVKVEYNYGVQSFRPLHPAVKSFYFEDSGANEANLADAMARVAEDNGMSANDIQYLFPAVLRMLKSKSIWSK